jgi:hypothetical protein
MCSDHGWQVGGIVGITMLVPLFAAMRVISRRSFPSNSQLQRAPMLVHTTLHE